MRSPARYVFIGWILAATACTIYRVPLNADNAPILLFDGAGTSANDVAAIEALLNKNHLNYSTVNSSQLNQMPGSQLKKYRLLIVPGGNFIDIAKNLTSDTNTKVRTAVQNGLNYLGICAGAFFASNYSGYNGLNLTSGVRFGFYSAEEKGDTQGSSPHRACPRANARPVLGRWPTT
jgi:hypothetical protein